MTPFQQKLERFIQRLQSGTSDASLEWTLVDEDSVSTKTKAGTVTLYRTKDRTGQQAVGVKLIGSGAKETLTFDDTDLLHFDDFGDPIHYFEYMSSLFDSALRNAKGEEGLLNAFLDSLSDDIPF